MIARFFQLLGALKRNWGKFFLYLLFVIVFVVILFPLDDLGDFVSSQVAKITQNSVYVRFEKMGISIIPQPGMQLKQVYIETNNLAPLKATELTLTPSFGGILNQKPYGHFSARGFMKGDIDLGISNGKRSDNNKERYELDLTAKNLSLFDIRELVNLPIILRGQLSLDVKNAQIDPTFTDQPDMEIALNVDKFVLPASNLPTQKFETITLPELKLGKIKMSGRLAGGRLNVTQGSIGEPGDEIFGDVKMNLGLTLLNNNGMITPVIGAYSVELDLQVKKSFQDRAGLFLGFLDQFKTPTPEGGRYKFKVSASSPFEMARMDAMH